MDTIVDRLLVVAAVSTQSIPTISYKIVAFSNIIIESQKKIEQEALTSKVLKCSVNV
jgi:hypothetical protein